MKIKLIPAKVNRLTLDTFINKINTINDSNNITLSNKNLTSLGFVTNKELGHIYYLTIDKVFIKSIIVTIGEQTILHSTYIKYNKNGDIIKSETTVNTSMVTLSGSVQKTLNKINNG